MMWKGAILLTCLVFSACAHDPYLKLSDDERRMIDAVDVFLEVEDVEAYVMTEDARQRAKLAEDWVVVKRYGLFSDEIKKAISEGQVIVGMNKDAVLMAVGEPSRIRKHYETDAEEYVEIYQYRYERDKKGRVFLSPPNSRTAYKNDVFERHIEFVDGLVRAIKEVP